MVNLNKIGILPKGVKQALLVSIELDIKKCPNENYIMSGELSKKLKSLGILLDPVYPADLIELRQKLRAG